MTTALIVVDEQPGFCEMGSLPVEGGHQVCIDTAQAIENNTLQTDIVVTTQDWHIEPGTHWSDNPNFDTTWPQHCKAGTPEAELNSTLKKAVNYFNIVNTKNLVEPVYSHFYKGMTSAAYSGFEALTIDVENKQFITLNQYLQTQKTKEIYVCGIAWDYCVKATVVDGIKFGYKVNLVENLSVAVFPEKFDETKQELVSMGVEIVRA